MRALAEKYFGGWRQEVTPAQPPSAAEARPRPLEGPLELQQSAKAGPAFMQAFYRPGIASADAPIYDIIRSTLLQPLVHAKSALRLMLSAPFLRCF